MQVQTTFKELPAFTQPQTTGVLAIAESLLTCHPQCFLHLTHSLHPVLVFARPSPVLSELSLPAKVT